MQTVHSYYDWTEPKQHSADDEGNLVQLCDRCARPLLNTGDIALAQNGDEYSSCERCGAPQDERP
jgi:hypothetical protein